MTVQVTLGQDDGIPDFSLYPAIVLFVAINKHSGELYVAKPLDRESIDLYQLVILVTDGKFIDTANVTVIVQDSNDNPQILEYRCEIVA
jgi:hypothetical protein